MFGVIHADVLGEILTHLSSIDPPTKRPGVPFEIQPRFSLGWITATHVCRHWRAVGINMAMLWAEIICSLPNAAAMSILLQRSRGCLLDIVIEEGVSLIPKIEFALDHLDRTRSLSCGPSYFWDNLLGLESHSLPALRRLSLSQYIEGMDTSIARIIVLDASHLQSLSLENVFFSLARPCDTLYNLHTLDIRGPCALPHPAWGLLELLSKTPRLEHLRLQMLLFYHAEGGLWDQYRGVVHLDHLRVVALTGGPHADIAGFWERISAPPDIDIYVNFRADPPEDLAASLDRQLRCASHNTISVYLARARHLSVSTFTLEPVARSRVILDGGGGATLGLLRDLDCHIQLENITRLSVQLYSPYTWIDGPLIAFAHKCSSVKELTLHMDSVDNFDIILVTAGALPLFPSLETLSVQFDAKALKSDKIYRGWWTELRHSLEERQRMTGMRVHTLRLSGRWGWRDAGIEAIDEEVMGSMLDLALVDKVIDDRVW